jgi:hypothetical protein
MPRSNVRSFAIRFASAAACSAVSACSSPLPRDSQALGGTSTALWPEPADTSASGGAGGENPWIGSGSSSPADPDAPAGSSGSDLLGRASGGEASAAGGSLNPVGSGGGSEESGGNGPGSGGEPEASPELWLARYVETPTAEKQLWLSNVGRTVADGECELVVYANGSLEPYRRHLLPQVSPHGILRLCTTSVRDTCEVSLGASSFNGNDALVVSCLGEVVDSFGRLGEDPGKAWGKAPLSSADAALVRCDRERDIDPRDAFFVERGWALAPVELSLSEALATCPSSNLGGSSGT